MATAKERRARLDRQRAMLGPIVRALGLSPETVEEDDEETDDADLRPLEAKIAAHGLVVVRGRSGATFADGTGYVYATVANPRIRPGRFGGMGTTRAEALCHAAAAAFLGVDAFHGRAVDGQTPEA